MIFGANWQGPGSLYSSLEAWPNDVTAQEHLNDDAIKEMVQNPPEATHALTVNECNNADNDKSRIIDMGRHGTVA